MGGTGLPEGKAHFTLPVQVNYRVLDRPQPGKRHGEDDRVDPGRKLP